jgi:16S rRNA processing protein RimM
MKISELEFITVGKILAPWGIKGKVKLEAVTDFPERFSPKSIIYIKRQPMTIDSVEWYKSKVIIKLNTIDSIEEAQQLRNEHVEIPYNQLYPLAEGQYYHFQLIGLEVLTSRGESLGYITDIISANSNDNYVVSGAKGEILIPAIDDVVKSIDICNGYLVIEAIEGLLNLNQKAGK